MVLASCRYRLLLLAGTALVSVGTSLAVAGPDGGKVVGGSATIQGQGTGSVTINQSSQRAVINWNTFNIGAGQTTTFIQPNSSSVALNRVVGGLGPTTLYGTLLANGQVFIINGDGVLIGPNAVINTAGFLATTSDVCGVTKTVNCDKADDFKGFMAGQYNFNIPGNPNASVVNLGTITASSGGFAALVAPGVRNSGTITATLGTVALASGNAFTLDFYGDKLITLAVSDVVASQVIDVATGKPLTSLVGNDGKLSANGGRVQLTASAARAVVDSVINNTGVIEADTVGTKNGMIVLGAATADSKPPDAPVQTVKLAGKISAAGKDKGTKGGSVVVTGEGIALAGANIDASGDAGGGKVLVGGDTGGGKPSAAAAGIELAKLESFVIPTATKVSVDAASVINASATGKGNGGKVVLWSNQQTTFAGTILARGGAAGGNGGFVETSSHGVLNFTGTVDLRASLAKAGTLLLDPADFYINPDTGAPTVPAGASVMTESQVEAQLGLGNLTIITDATKNPSGQNGDIWVNSNINWSSNNTLTLSAYRDINIAATVTIRNSGESTPSGNLVLRADNTGTGTGTLNFTTIPGIDGGPPTFGQIDFSSSNGAVSIYYNSSPRLNCEVRCGKYNNPTDFIGNGYVLTNDISNQLTAYMLVNNVNDLQSINQNVGRTGVYALGKNIDASATASWNEGAGFLPIGTSVNPFAGLLDGQGYTIDQLTINSSAQLVGLFARNNGTIRNVGLTNSNVTTTGNTQFLGILAGANNGLISNSHTGGQAGNYSGAVPAGKITGAYGGLAGLNDGKGAISNSYSTASVRIVGPTNGGYVDGGGLVGQNHGSISFSYAQGAVSGQNTSNEGSYLGGLVGWNRPGASITQSYASGSVTGAGSFTFSGGLVGVNENGASITASYALGSVSGTNDVGGLVASNFGTVTQTYATGAVIGTGDKSNVGALIGSNGTNGSVTQSYWDATIAGSTPGIGSNFAGIVDATGLSTADFMKTSSFVGWQFAASPGGCSGQGACWVIVDGDGSLNNAGGAAGATRPFLLSELSTTISNSHQLQLTVVQPGASYKLANDISLGTDLQKPSSMWGSAGFVPIGNISFGGFTGTFDGKNYTIDGLKIAPTDPSVNNIGLFGTIYGSVSNLVLTNAGITANPSVGGPSQFVGVLAGQNAGTVSNVFAAGTVNGTPNNLAPAGGVIAGGLVGQNGVFSNNNQSETPGTIKQSFANVNVTVGDTVPCNGSDCNGGQNSAGGLAGFNTPNSTITDSQAIGAVQAGAFGQAGGLVGQNFGTITSTLTLTTIPTPKDSPLSSCPQGVAYSCAGGTVTVGSQGVAGGLAGFNDGVIGLALATGAVTGAAGQPPGSNNNNGGNNNLTQLGGLVGVNTGTIGSPNNGAIGFAFAMGTVGTVGVANLEVGGLVAENHGSIVNAIAIGAVNAGDNSMAGGLTASNSPSNNNNCTGGCLVGIGHDNSATISASIATGDVTVGAASFAGGLSGTGDGVFAGTIAIGNVTGGANSVLGGLVGGIGVGQGKSSISDSFASIGTIKSTGPNSVVGGLVGANGGSIMRSGASGPVSGTSQSYLGGLVGINVGLIQDSNASGVVTGSGAGNFTGGLVGLNFGLVDPSTSSGAVTSGANSVVGGLIGANGAFGPFSNIPPGVSIPGSFPVGTVSVDSLATGLASGGPGSLVGPQFGENYPTSGLPSYPTVVNPNICNNGLCTILATGVLTNPNPPPPPTNPPSNPPANQPPPPPVTQAQVIQNLIQNITLASVTLGDVVNTLPLDQPPRCSQFIEQRRNCAIARGGRRRQELVERRNELGPGRF
ncbi:MAG TPA: filamentous hemagglutinin N-terminal domain-containing protein, partial [Xanthobacteraceae bacterium]